MAKQAASPKKESAPKESAKKGSPKKEGKKKEKKEAKEPAKNLREYTIAKDLPPRLVPSSVKRETKSVQRFTETKEEKEEKPIVIPKGKGKKLADLPNVEALIKKRPKSDDLLRLVHSTLLGKVSKSVDIKENLLKFNGLVYDDDEKGRIRLENKLNTIMLKPLRQLCAFFGLDPEGEREDVVTRLADFLEKPKDTGETFEIPGDKKKRKRSSSRSRSRSSSPAKKKKKKDPNAPKRPLSAYMMFCNDKRPALVKKYPKEGVTDIAKRLGAKWKSTSAEDRKPFQKEADKDKARYEKEMKKYKPSK